MKLGISGRKRSLRKRYGHSWPTESIITRPAGGGRVDLIAVDNKGTILRVIARKIPYSLAVSIIKRVHR